MNLKMRDLRLLTEIFALLAKDHSGTEIRQILGQKIMELLQAQTNLCQRDRKRDDFTARECQGEKP